MKTMMTRVALLAGVLSFSAGAFADCGPPGPITLRTPDGRLTVTLHFRGNLEVRRPGQPVQHTKIDLHGHHYQAALTPSGDRLVVWDSYEGIGIYQLDGRTVRYYDGNQFLTRRQIENRTGKWACHPEGRWLDKVTLSVDQASIRLYDGNSARVRLSDGSRVDRKAASSGL